MSLDELTPWLLLANLLLVAGVLLIALRRGGGSAALGGQGDLERLYEKQAAQIDQSRRDLLKAVARSQSTLQNEVHGVQRAMLEDGGKLRTDLMERFEQLSKSTYDQLSDGKLVQQRSLAELKQSLETGLANHRQSFEQRQGDALKAQQEALTKGMSEVSRQVGEALGRSAEQLSKRVEGLAETTDKRLKEISGQVEQRLAKGFEKTTETFSQVLQHLTRIDEAQKKITELSSNVVSLQEVLTEIGRAHV